MFFQPPGEVGIAGDFFGSNGGHNGLRNDRLKLAHVSRQAVTLHDDRTGGGPILGRFVSIVLIRDFLPKFNPRAVDWVVIWLEALQSPEMNVANDDVRTAPRRPCRICNLDHTGPAIPTQSGPLDLGVFIVRDHDKFVVGSRLQAGEQRVKIFHSECFLLFVGQQSIVGKHD